MPGTKHKVRMYESGTIGRKINGQGKLVKRLLANRIIVGQEVVKKNSTKEKWSKKFVKGCGPKKFA